MATSIGELLRSEAFSDLIERGGDVFSRYRFVPTPGLEYISPAVERITGYAPHEFYADPTLYLRLVHGDDQAKLALLTDADAPAAATDAPITLRWMTKDGRIVWVQQLVTRITDERGDLVAAETLSRDVTDELALAQRARQPPTSDALGRLVSGIAHDFNNLLGVILGHTQLLSRRVGRDDAESLDAILEATERGAALIGQLLDGPRPRSGAVPADEPGLTPRPVHGHETVLVVEGEPILRRLLRNILSEHGYRVLTAGCADEALAVSGGESGVIDLLITDVFMPGVSGRALAELLLARRAGLRVLYISGTTDDELLRQGISRQQVAFVAKPFTEDRLLAEVQSILDG